MFNQCKHTLCLHFASRGGVRPCKAAMACASSVQAGHSLPRSARGKGSSASLELSRPGLPAI